MKPLWYISPAISSHIIKFINAPTSESFNFANLSNHAPSKYAMVLAKNQKGRRLIYPLLRSSKLHENYRHHYEAESRKMLRRWWKYGMRLLMHSLFMLWNGVTTLPCHGGWSRPMLRRMRLMLLMRSSMKYWRRWAVPARRFWFIFGSRRGGRCRRGRLKRSRSWRGRSLGGGRGTEDGCKCDEPVYGEAGGKGLLHSKDLLYPI